ncbi:hypothetical protein [Haloarcula salinisoli]|uniref:Uncharacterized protein n=1 Tax=Haloarcula salinisoli TaxID=2487746 RepID=A0A8J7YFJ2_9EURY|nr:hypothetical protein [Halomicroarcula salinisoli]MBX0286081.1 hypothetical protein [Halomicroarcula salinisoli]MBX0302431.1 hypothetical protein [Halomicroarcula salinisoli]
MVPETATERAAGRSPRSLSPLFWVGIALAMVSGGIHLWLGAVDAKPPLLAAGVGFLVGIVAVVLNVRRQMVVQLGIPFTAVQILLYGIGHGFLTPAALEYTSVQLADKGTQIALVAVLVVIVRRDGAE